MIRYNMNKISLKPNDKVSKYLIDSVTGYGASCIVYKAWYKEDNNSEPHWVQLKELYPYDIDLFRDASNNLICKTEEDKKKFDEYKKNFEASNNMLVKLNRLTDSTPREIQSFPYNGTKYSIVAYSNGKQYSEKALQKIELNKLLGIIESLAISVNRLHEEGYLHLDIKPDNFLINDIGSAILFDVDSVVPIDEIKYRNGISYSKKWAAPEVKYATEKSDYKDISCKSDIFSIGVILFEAIMGRDFLPMETVSYNRNWDVENSIKAREEKQNRKVNINPKFYHKIKEIFEKTLDRNPNKRYNSAQELYDNLDKARDILKENPWIIPSFRTVTPQFTGRKNELSKMNSVLQKENTVFLHGFGGIGKSELALKYAEIYKDDFDTVVFCKYQESIKNALLNIEIANEDKTTLHRIKELCDKRTLIILDNFDVETDTDDYLDDFVNNYNCRKIITTRTNFSKLYTQLEVESLEQEDAILLFEKESKWLPKTENEEETLNEILKLIGYHTYFTVIFAKKKEMFSLTIDELKKQTEETLLKKSGKVEVVKDGKLTQATIDALAERLFDFDSITERQKQTLRNLCLLSWITLSRSVYTEIAGYDMGDEEKIELIDSLNDLTRLGWVLYNEKTDDFFLHPIMQELVKKKLTPTPENCPEVFGYMTKFTKDIIKNTHNISDAIEYLSAFISGVSLDNEENFKYLADNIENCRLNGNLLKTVKSVLLSKTRYKDIYLPVISELLFPYRGNYLNRSEEKQILNNCFLSYQNGMIADDRFRTFAHRLQMWIDSLSGGYFGECDDKVIQKETWEITVDEYINKKRAFLCYKGTSKEECEKVLCLIKNAIKNQEEIADFWIERFLDYAQPYNDENVIKEIAKTIVKTKNCFLSYKMMNAGWIIWSKDDLALCNDLIAVRLDYRSLSASGKLLFKAQAYKLIGDRTNFLKCYEGALNKVKGVNINRWCSVNREVLKILSSFNLDVLSTQEFVETTESYVADMETSFKSFPSYNNVCEEWYLFLLKCLRHSKDSKKRELYNQKLNKTRGKKYGFEMKK